MTCRFQFSLRSILLLLTGLAISLAAIVQVPHVFIFAVGCACAVISSLAAYRITRNLRPRISKIVAATSILVTTMAAWALLYVLSLGPFIALSEFERKITRQHHLGWLAETYRPAMSLNQWQFVRWYMSRWIPVDAVGLHVLYPVKISPDLVGTWRGEFANILNFRADGTARGRFFAKYPKKTYSEWTCEGDRLVIYQFGSKKSAFAWFGSQMMNYGPTDSYQVIHVSADQFKLRATSGRIYSFTRTQDVEVESVP